MLTREEIRDRIALLVPELMEGTHAHAMEKMLAALESTRTRKEFGDRTQARPEVEFLGNPSASRAIACEIRDPSGGTTMTVPAFEYGDQSYFFYYISNGVESGKVVFHAIPLFSGSPMVSIDQQFVLDPPSVTNILTPFGVPFWSQDLTSGDWVLIVRSDQGGAAFCFFRVVPY
jgi:hypothetical protein